MHTNKRQFILISVHSWLFAVKLVNHLFIRYIRVTRGLTVFRSERGDDFFEARIAAERVPEGQQL